MRKEIPVRHSNPPNSKYYLSLFEYPYRYLPDFANGAGYAFSKAAVQKLSVNIPFTDVLRHNDDVYVGMLVHDAKIQWTDDNRFDPGNVYDYPRRCDLWGADQVHFLVSFHFFRDIFEVLS